MKKPKSLRETLCENQKAERSWAAAFGTKPREFDPIPEKRKYVRKTQECPTEHEEQKLLVAWWRKQYPAIRMFSIPNAAQRTPELASYLRAEGMTKGVPDLYIPERRLWIEMKRVKGSTISEEQKDWARYLLSIGDKHIFAFGFDDAVAKIRGME